MTARPFFCLLFAAVHLGACGDKDSIPDNRLPFANTPVTQKLSTQFPEVSGIAPSLRQPGLIWLMEDGGNPTQITLLTKSGAVAKHVFLKGISNRDWEDMVIVKAPAQNTPDIYLADIGNNNAVNQESIIYRLAEPDAGTDTVKNITAIHFNYPDGPHDAEAFIVDPKTLDIFVITKKETRSRIYRIEHPYNDGGNAEFVGELPYNTVVSATVNEAGNEILIKTYMSVYYYKKSADESMTAALLKTPTTLGYQLEVQGESICFASDNNGFYTVPEMPLEGDQLLSFYKRQ